MNTEKMNLLNTVLLRFSGGAVFTIGDAVEGGTGILGSTGSGKTHGSGTCWAHSFLSHGFGGLVLTAKPDEVDLWRRYCEQTNRIDDLIVVEPGGPHRFSLLDYEVSKNDGNVSVTQNIVSLIETVIESGREKSSGQVNDSFWASAQTMLITSVASLCLLAGDISVQAMYDVALSAPKGDEERGTKKEDEKESAFQVMYEVARENVMLQVEAFLETLAPEEHKKMEKEKRLEGWVIQNVSDYRMLLQIDQFFAVSYRKLHSKTRSIVEFSFIGFLFQLLQEPFYSLFCNGPSTFTPEDCITKGKIIILNLPVKIYQQTGQQIQIAIKYAFQRAWERRGVLPGEHIPFLWCDEAHLFLHPHDAHFLSTARSSMIATVYLSQSIVGYYASMGGNKSEYKVKSLLGLLSTKIFHANTCMDTNRWASDLFGEEYQTDHQRGVQVGRDFSQSYSESEKLYKRVRPEQFVSLKTGGKKNNYIVEAYIHRQGSPFSNGLNFKKVRFRQKPSL
ncbi:TraM recognition domain-containing protein [Chitinophaga pendula]|uniref:type IV secretory system conjugative DNA transfer family protein n=1 Tax=Chitinophaga TaxID=79328 RepID=UPI000BAFF4B6|nr:MULTISPECIES: TraM recognition domain-containing protein [Chitinophaga]ASZ11175.1 hypothetical protein CK934_09475 [Chitinophaga sp. MD30]UCJ05828.1 TraM recognition domain-containing protein [Chitinophaga pendula]